MENLYSNKDLYEYELMNYIKNMPKILNAIVHEKGRQNIFIYEPKS